MEKCSPKNAKDDATLRRFLQSDSNVFAFRVSNRPRMVIKVWDQGVATMSLGESSALLIDAYFRYGPR
jgi:FKBP-type peptidyl-prolyl cis-trans isomerase